MLQEEFCPDELQSFSHIRVNMANTRSWAPANTKTSTEIEGVIQKLELGKMVVYLSKTEIQLYQVMSLKFPADWMKGLLIGCWLF